MTKTARIMVASSLLLLLFAVGGLWLAADRLLDEVARPWLIEQAAAALDAEVDLTKLTYADGRLRLIGMTAIRPGELRFEVAAIDLHFTWSGLLQRRIDELVIREPQLVWTAPVQETASEQATWPQDPPLDITAWRLENGRAELAWGDRKLRCDQLAGEGGLGRQFLYAITANCGAANALPLSLAGSARWQDGLALTLNELSWDKKNLLSQPVSVTPGVDQALGAKLGLAQLDDAELGGLLTALGEPIPWPPELHWQLTAPALELSFRGGQIDVRLQSGAGVVQTAGRRWPWLSMNLRVQGNPERLELAGHVDLAGSATLTVTGIWSDQQLNGSWSATVASPAGLLQSVDMDLPTSALAPRDLKLHGQIEASHDSVRISKARLTTSLGERGTLASDLRAEWRDERLSLACDHMIITDRGGSTPVAEATLAVKSTPGGAAWQGDWSLQVAELARLARYGGFPLSAELPNLKALSLQGKLQYQDGRLSLPGVNVTGQLTGAGLSGALHGQLALQTAPGIDLAVMLKSLTLDAFDYQAEDGMAGVIGGKLTLNGRFELVGERLGFNLNGRAVAAEALLDSWYGSLEGLPVSFALQGNWLSARQRLELTKADVDLASMVSGHFTGVYVESETSLRGQIEIPQLQGAFQKTLQTLTAELLPGIAQVSLGGQLVFDGAARQQKESWALDVAIVPTEVSIDWGEKARIDGLHGRLPIYLRQGSFATDGVTETASLQWAHLQSGLLNSGPGRMDLQASANSWQLQRPLELSVAGGEVRLTALHLDLPKLVPQLRASLEVKDLELLQLSKSLGWPVMGGLLNVSLEDVRIAGDEISTVGDASMHAFGGAFTVNNMRVEAPFSRFPTYHADVDFTGIDLYQLTNTFAFGEMNGIADGYIHDLRLFDGTPSALRAKVETRSEGVRNISVKAIRNLNTLSMGGLSAALSQGIYQFIDFYRYRKIGIVCWLQNDVFHLEGTGREGSDTYLIYGGLLPPRIDVVVSSPTISFKEMLGRLKRIDRADN